MNKKIIINKLDNLIGKEIVVTISSFGYCRLEGVLCQKNSTYIILISEEIIYIPLSAITSIKEAPMIKEYPCQLTALACTNKSNYPFKIFMNLCINGNDFNHVDSLCYMFQDDDNRVRLLINNTLGEINLVDSTLDRKTGIIATEIKGSGEVTIDSTSIGVCQLKLVIESLLVNTVSKLKIKELKIISQAGVIIHGLEGPVLLSKGCINTDSSS